MSKNAEGWIRHRGGKCPVDAGVKVDYRMRNGKLGINERSELLDWGLSDESPKSDIMAYRLHKPAEQVEARSKPELKINLPGGYGEIYNAQAVEHGPLQWHDRITEIDAITQALTTKRAELVQKLAGEGFALIGRINELLTDAAQKHDDMSDWRNWKVGDRIEVISNGFDGRDIGEMLTVDGLDSDDNDQPVGVMGDDGAHSWPMFSDDHFSCIKFHSRPSD